MGGARRAATRRTEEAILRLDSIFSGATRGGVYRYGSRTTSIGLAARAAAAGWLSFYLDGTQITSKAALLDSIGRAADLPAYSGRNWDALEESLRDLSWAPARGYVLLWDHARLLAQSEPAAFATAVSILRSAADEWARQGIPFVALLRA
jgi:hypothetical protein